MGVEHAIVVVVDGGDRGALEQPSTEQGQGNRQRAEWCGDACATQVAKGVRWRGKEFNRKEMLLWAF